MKEAKIYRCPHCGNIVLVLVDGGVNPVCCGQKMEQLTAKTGDQGMEKHVPEVVKDGESLLVKVGSIPHPMLEEHSIQWIALVGEKDTYIHYLHPGEAPEARFPSLKEGTAYSHCNIHGLWKSTF